MSRGEIHIGDVNTIIERTVKDQNGSIVDLSSVTVKKFVLTKPDRTKVEWDAAFTTDGTDGKIRYVIDVGDLDLSGDWKLQVYLEFPVGIKWSDITHFTVYANL